MKQSLLIFAAILLGIVLPYGHAYTWLIKYNLFVMLLLAFINIDFERRLVTMRHAWILLFNLALPALVFLLLRPLSLDLALVALIMAISPTAAAAPVLSQFMHTDTGFVTIAVLITSPVIALTIPFVLPAIVEVRQAISVGQVLLPALAIVALPLLISLSIKRSSNRVTAFLVKYRWVSFVLFMVNAWIGCSKATHFIRHEHSTGLDILWKVALVTALVCVLNFGIGLALGKGQDRFATSLALGRKNTMFALWLALTFVSPLVALGPICYIIYQNAYNSYQIMLAQRRWQRREKGAWSTGN